jgi:signal transduction histidine kinase
VAAVVTESEQFALVLEHLPIGVVMFDARRKTVTYANLAARRAVHPEKLLRRHELPDAWPGFSLRGYAEHVVGPGPTVGETVELEDGRAFLVSGITDQNTRVAAIFVEDISRRERRARAEREFVSNAAHELLTPLTGIVGAAHVLQAGAKEVPQDRDHFIDHIATECSRLTRVARSLLILARAQSGEEPPRLEIIKLCELLQEVVELLDASVTVRCGDELTVLADADLFVQAFTNLIANVVRHGSGGEVVVQANEVGRLVEVDIVDIEAVGPGAIGLGKRFRSGSGRDGGGFGLGLSIAAQSLEAMNAHLFLEEGSTRVEIARGGFSE